MLNQIALEAMKFVMMMFKNPKKAQKMKKQYEEQVGLHEVFLESVPTALVITMLMVTSTTSKFSKDNGVFISAGFCVYVRS